MNQQIKLPHGVLAILKKKAGVSYNTVLRTIHGESENEKVLDALNDYLEKRKRRQELLKEVL